MTDFSKEIAALRLFNEKADKLENMSLKKAVRDGNTSWFLSASKGGETTFGRQGPDQEAIDAYTLTYRFFIQDREPCSLRNLGKFYPNLPIDLAMAQQFGQIRSQINQVLAATPAIAITIDNTKAQKQYTMGEVIDTFLNGGLAHANNAALRARYESWRSMPMVFTMFEQNYIHALAVVTQGILIIRDINAKALEQLLAPQLQTAGNSKST